MAAYQARVLVIANQTAGSPELVAALQARQEKGPMVPTLLMPGVIGDPDPAVAVQETWDPRSFDEVIVSTLPGATSKWLQADLPHRVQQITGCVVQHVEGGRKREPNYGPVPDKPDRDA